MTARRAIRRMLRDAAGTTALEYAILAGLVAVVILGGAASVGRALDSYYGETRDEMVDEREMLPEPGREVPLRQQVLDIAEQIPSKSRHYLFDFEDSRSCN